MARLFLSRRTINFLLVLLFISQFIVIGFFSVATVAVGTSISVLILLLFLRYASLHTSLAEVYGVFLQLLLVLTLANLTSITLFYLILGRLRLAAALYVACMSLSILLVYVTVVKLRLNLFKH